MLAFSLNHKFNPPHTGSYIMHLSSVLCSAGTSYKLHNIRVLHRLVGLDLKNAN